MDTIGWIKTIWDYNYWAQHKLLDCIDTVSEEDFVRDVPYSIGSLQAQVVHTLWAEDLWYCRMMGTALPTYTADDLPERAAIRAKWDTVETQWRAFVADLTPDQLTRTFSAQVANGTFTHTAHEALLHVVNHSTDHRAQMLRLIHDYGGETFAQDMIYYLREQQS